MRKLRILRAMHVLILTFSIQMHTRLSAYQVVCPNRIHSVRVCLESVIALVNAPAKWQRFEGFDGDVVIAAEVRPSSSFVTNLFDFPRSCLTISMLSTI